MPTKVDDLWPSDLGTTDLVAPVAILRQQAAALGKKTTYILTGEVTTEAKEGTIYHSFFIVCPSLDNYRYKVLWMSHAAIFYPVTIYSEDADLFGRDAKDQPELLELLKKVFSSQKLRQVIESLIVQAQAG